MLLLREIISKTSETGGSGNIHGDVDELDEVADETHDCETDSDCLGDLNELCMTRMA